MKRHLVTVAILLVALTLCTPGFSDVGAVALVAGAGFALWSRFRLVVRRDPAGDTGASHTR